jgi:hypothetical protein
MVDTQKMSSGDCPLTERWLWKPPEACCYYPLLRSTDRSIVLEKIRISVGYGFNRNLQYYSDTMK